MAKTAEREVKTPKEVLELTPEQKIAEIRNLRAGGLFVGNMTYVDALLAAYDSEKAAVLHLGQATAALLSRAETAESKLRETADDRDSLVQAHNDLAAKFNRVRERWTSLEDEKTALEARIRVLELDEE
jgi:pyruvate/oxaloacetate carboxyltransferase